jgi:hypothetical protein
MRKSWLLIGLVAVAATANAKEPKPYQTGTLLRMDAVHCGQAEKDAKSVAGELLGTDSGSKKSEEVLCQEYVLQGDNVIYRLRPHDEKHPVLLPIGSSAQFRMDKDKLLLRVAGGDEKEREYIVVSMAPRTDNVTAGATVPSSNQQ